MLAKKTVTDFVPEDTGALSPIKKAAQKGRKSSTSEKEA
jgi:hypothetical protein